jgi:hypothetical protein
MSDFYFKTTPERSDPRDARTTPGNDLAEHKAAENVRNGKLHFENEAEHKDYIRQVKQNPNNKYGLPVYYPALELKSFTFFDDSYTREMLQKGYWKHCESCGVLINANHYEHDCSQPLQYGERNETR